MNVSELLGVKPNTRIPALAPGDTVRVSVKVVEGEKERIQSFQGVVIRVNSGGINGSFTVRRVAYGVGVERTFPLYSPLIERVRVLRHGQVRRAKLYYLRGLTTKKARLKEKRLVEKLGAAEELARPEETPPELPAEQPAVAETPEQAEQGTQAEAPAAQQPEQK